MDIQNLGIVLICMSVRLLAALGFFVSPNEALVLEAIFIKLPYKRQADCTKIECTVADQCMSTNILSTRHLIGCLNLTGTEIDEFHKTKQDLSCLNGGYFKDKNRTSCICKASFAGSFCERYWDDCAEGFHLGRKKNGVYTIHPGRSLSPFRVYCFFGKMGKTLIQRQMTGIDFYRNWQEYTDGFGIPGGDHWLGLKKIKAITDSNMCQLRVRIKFVNSSQWHSRIYQNFTLSGEYDGYRMTTSNTLTRRSSNRHLYDAVSQLSGARFSTYDRDNDESPNQSCATTCHAGWWFKNCTCASCNPNGRMSGRKWDPLELQWGGKRIHSILMLLGR